MRDIDLFQLALGLVPPWMVVDAKFDVDKKRLDIEIDFKTGGRFACPECGKADCPVHDTVITITEDKLKELSVGFGEVTKINLITDRATGEPRGFGFVEMPTQSQAEAAIKGLNGTSVGGMTIQVNIARDRRRR
jgi:hypothetical protein